MWSGYGGVVGSREGVEGRSVGNGDELMEDHGSESNAKLHLPKKCICIRGVTFHVRVSSYVEIQERSTSIENYRDAKVKLLEINQESTSSRAE